MESGEYTRARQIYHTALEQIRTLSGRYAGAQALLALKQELERASGRALAACIAENEVAGKRNAQPVQCQ
jgi:hypothetical protein